MICNIVQGSSTDQLCRSGTLCSVLLARPLLNDKSRSVEISLEARKREETTHLTRSTFDSEAHQGFPKTRLEMAPSQKAGEHHRTRFGLRT